jgi:hypothetical protein
VHLILRAEFSADIHPRAFVFAAALILGLILFTDENAARDVRNSLAAAIEVMKKLSRRSRQAEHYHFILRDMEKDIDCFQEQIAMSKRESSRRPVRRLMQSARESNTPFPASDPLHDENANWTLPADISLASSAVPTFSFPSTIVPDSDEAISSWNFPSIQFWDDLSTFGPGSNSWQ